MQGDKTLGHRQNQWLVYEGSSPRRGLKWWLRPIPLAIGAVGVSLITTGMIGFGSGGSGSGASGDTVAVELGMPGTRVGDMVAQRARGNGSRTTAATMDDSPAAVSDNGAPADSGPLRAANATAADMDSGWANYINASTGSTDASDDTAGSAAEAEADLEELAAPHEGPEWETIEVRSGDSLAAIFSRAGLSAGELHRLINTDDRTAQLQRIYPGDEIHFHVESDALQGLRYDIDDADTLVVARGDDGFDVSIESRAIETRVKHASGTVNSSLFVAGQDAGLSHGQIMRLMNIFKWQVDFGRDVRSGDMFSVAYESYYIDDEHVRDGPILAARYVNRGNAIDAVRYEDPDGNRGFYNPEGENLRKAFIRRPVGDARISSGFNPNRKHPVLGVRRPHLGTDFAAPSGTPIRAAGAGRVVHASRKGGYGRTVIIEHAGRYRTLYAHMSGYASGISVGTRVEQGQTIGYVGASGLVTGAHLHYEFIKDGVHRNPMRVDLPSGDPVASEHMDDFIARAAPLVAQLDDMHEEQEQQLAMRDEE
ncbi:Peptidase family M23 [Aquisalimonas asiatica]|uniref:Peptidase family M23 n=1 Tax=Aquisalimonas asiatica TaxID=406100 RepID=A0A1H8VKK8_9GAMM|nr:Peptidase family M23 [Aquisalimonas asiatica]